MIYKLKMNNPAVISPYTQHNFSSRKLCLWGKQQRFILVNLLDFAVNIVIKDLFLVTHNILKK